jgi:hypothetical protein
VWVWIKGFYGENQRTFAKKGLQRKGFEGEEWGRLERKTQQTHWCFCGLE